MPPVKRRPRPAAAGADRGASWTRFCAVDARGKPLRSERVPTRAIRFFPGMFAAFLDRCSAPAGVPVCVATRGALSRAWKREYVASALAGRARTVSVISDAEAAYASALGAKKGLLLIAGTGSVALAPDGRGSFVKAGGHAPEGGDPGSGLWLGLAWLALRKKKAPSGGRAASRAAALAREVLRLAREGSAEELSLAEKAWEELSLLAAELAAGGFLPAGRGPLPAALWGGLTDDPWFRAGLRGAVESRLGRRLRLFRPAAAPELFCARLALKDGERRL